MKERKQHRSKVMEEFHFFLFSSLTFLHSFVSPLSAATATRFSLQETKKKANDARLRHSLVI